jgi:hypothetical protein
MKTNIRDEFSRAPDARVRGRKVPRKSGETGWRRSGQTTLMLRDENLSRQSANDSEITWGQLLVATQRLSCGRGRDIESSLIDRQLPDRIKKARLAILK